MGIYINPANKYIFLLPGVIRSIHSHRVWAERSSQHLDRGCKGRGGRLAASNRTLPGEPEVRHFRDLVNVYIDK